MWSEVGAKALAWPLLGEEVLTKIVLVVHRYKFYLAQEVWEI